MPVFSFMEELVATPSRRGRNTNFAGRDDHGNNGSPMPFVDAEKSVHLPRLLGEEFLLLYGQTAILANASTVPDHTEPPSSCAERDRDPRRAQLFRVPRRAF